MLINIFGMSTEVKPTRESVHVYQIAHINHA